MSNYISAIRMEVTKEWLEKKIDRLNAWLKRSTEVHFNYRLKTQNRDYYVRKLIELEETKTNTIKV